MIVVKLEMQCDHDGCDAVSEATTRLGSTEAPRGDPGWTTDMHRCWCPEHSAKLADEFRRERERAMPL